MARTGPAPADRAALPLQWPLVGRGEHVDLFETTLADPRAHGFVVNGAPGVGKTRLGDECLSVAHRHGRTVARATAAPGLQSVPLGALAPLLPASLGGARCDLVAVFDAVAPVLREQAEPGTLVLFVDDVHWLDETSATLLAQLVDADLVFLVGTMRADEPVSPSLTSLWLRSRVRRVDLDALDRTGVDTLLHFVLGGPATPGTIETVWSASRGNLLFVRELVLGAVESGRLRDEHGVWRLSGPLAATGRLLELVESRLAELGPDARAALDVLAVWAPTSIRMLESAVDTAVLEALDGWGMLTTRPDGRRDVVDLAHPLYGEVLRARMPQLARRRLLLEHAERIESLGARRRDDPMRIAAARVDAAAPADAHLLLEAARLARWAHDFPQVERLARAACHDGAPPEAALLLGEALHELGAFAEADQVLADALPALAPNDPLYVLVAEIRGRTLMWGLQERADALAFSRDARARCTDGVGADELSLNEAVLLGYSGRPLDALALVDSVPVSDSARARTLRALAEVPALIVTGKPVTAAEKARVSFSEHRGLATPMAITNPGVQLNHEIHALTDGGALHEALALGTSSYEALPPTAPPGAPMWLTLILGRVALLLGRPETARRWLGETIVRSDEHDVAGPRRGALSFLAVAHAWLGDRDASAAAVSELQRLPELPHSRAEQALGAAWAKAAAGDSPGGRAVLGAAAEDARASGHRISEAWLLHDIVRLGDATAAADRLDGLAATCEGDLVAAFAVHARAACGLRPDPFDDAAERFEAMGALLLAAEAASEAADAAQRRGDGRSAAAHRTRAHRLAQECEGARTPGLASADAVVPLSARERDIATYAAQGETAKEIAARLFLSTRTVNNHLQNVYTKLGISGRRELADALGLGEPLSGADR
jgi:DNA-binding CsgD family transcriptional regulator